MSESITPHDSSSQSDKSFDVSIVKFSAKDVQIASFAKCFFTHLVIIFTLYIIVKIMCDAFALY